MKDKNVAGILAFLLGGFGVHQFYLKRPGWGIFHLVLTFGILFTKAFAPLSWIIAWITGIVLFSMRLDDFNMKYNRRYVEDGKFKGKETDFERRRRYREQGHRRRDYRRERHEEYRDRRRHPDYEPAPRKKTNPYKQAGIKKYKEYDYNGAIEDFVKALEIDEKDIATHFNLACAYSLNEEADKAFFHLDKAVALGFKDFEKIKNHDAFAFIRIQEEFEAFEENKFRLEVKQETPQIEAPKEDLLNTQPDLLEQLKKLGELKDKGLLTEEEFSAQKRKLLG